MLKKIVLSVLLVISSYAETSYEALMDTITLLGNGAITQFQTKSNLYYLAPAVASTYWAFENDKRLSDYQRAKELKSHYDLVGDLGIVFNFPIVPISLYYLGRSNDNTKLVQFAKEYMAAMYLTLIETGLISYIPGHERPNTEGQSAWETEFRGKNSFPSGHIVPYSVLFFKTFQFYGPYWALIPAALTYASSMQRVREGRHYVSDIIGAFWLSAFASEGVRNAAGYDNNHPLYKRIFERVEPTVTHYRGVTGIGLRFRF
jgi:membrane-associated phospholipid phosphatase